jgi:hypothetical protein
MMESVDMWRLIWHSIISICIGLIIVIKLADVESSIESLFSWICILLLWIGKEWRG